MSHATPRSLRLGTHAPELSSAAARARMPRGPLELRHRRAFVEHLADVLVDR